MTTTHRWILVAAGLMAIVAAAIPRAAAAAAPAAANAASDPPTAPARPAETDRAVLLYETHCIGCHTSVAHRRADRRARSAVEVSRYVQRWSDYQKLGWSPGDVDDVTALLVRRYYRFNETPAPRDSRGR